MEKLDKAYEAVEMLKALGLPVSAEQVKAIVEKLGIMNLGMNIVSAVLHENEKYRTYQHEVENGQYVCTYLNTDRKLEVLKTINRDLNLNLIIEKVKLED